MNKIIPSPKEHVFFSSMAIILAAVIVCGFSNTYLPKLLNNPVIVPEIVHLHALIFSLWLAFFVFQVTLILRKKYDLHRRLGSYGVLFSFAMGVVGCATAVEVAKLGHIGIPGVEFPDAEGFLLLNLTSLFSFVSLTVLGWLFRNNASMHKRFMLMANAGGLTPPLSHDYPLLQGPHRLSPLYHCYSSWPDQYMTSSGIDAYTGFIYAVSLLSFCRFRPLYLHCLV